MQKNHMDGPYVREVEQDVSGDPFIGLLTIGHRELFPVLSDGRLLRDLALGVEAPPSEEALENWRVAFLEKFLGVDALSV